LLCFVVAPEEQSMTEAIAAVPNAALRRPGEDRFCRSRTNVLRLSME
jgi:hypothetical protein